MLPHLFSCDVAKCDRPAATVAGWDCLHGHPRTFYLCRRCFRAMATLRPPDWTAAIDWRNPTSFAEEEGRGPGSPYRVCGPVAAAPGRRRGQGHAAVYYEEASDAMETLIRIAEDTDPADGQLEAT